MSDEAYKLLDSGNCKKLEQAGQFRLIRPALNAFWKPSLNESEWDAADAVFERSSTGGGNWTWKRNPPPDWTLTWGGLRLLAKPTNFGHLGFFPEQANNWQWLRAALAQMPKGASTLNLFAYSGGATLAMAQGGASEACHLDASHGIIEWAKRNQALNPGTDKIRWICDDAMKFVSREQRRGRKYNGIILDPPSFGRGAQGQVWKIEDGICELMKSCKDLLDTSNPHFILLSCHSQGFSGLSLGRCLASVFPESEKLVEGGEMTIPEGGGSRVLPAGIYARLFKAN